MKTNDLLCYFIMFQEIGYRHMIYHYSDVIMGAMASQITSLTTVYSTDNSGADQRKHQSPVSLAFVRGIHRWPVTFPHKWPVTQKMFPFDDVIMITKSCIFTNHCRAQSQEARLCVYADRNLRNILSYNSIYTIIIIAVNVLFIYIYIQNIYVHMFALVNINIL